MSEFMHVVPAACTNCWAWHPGGHFGAALFVMPATQVDVLSVVFALPCCVLCVLCCVLCLAAAVCAVPQHRLWIMSINNFSSTYYAPLLFRPLAYLRGLRGLFGEHCAAIWADTCVHHHSGDCRKDSSHT